MSKTKDLLYLVDEMELITMRVINHKKLMKWLADNKINAGSYFFKLTTGSRLYRQIEQEKWHDLLEVNK